MSGPGFLNKPEGDVFSLRGKLLLEKSFRDRRLSRVRIRYCMGISSNLAGVHVDNGGDFTGNQWKSCTFFGLTCKNVRVDMNKYEKCAMGNMRLDGCTLWEITADECNCAAGIWKDTLIEDCTFRKCSFRNAQFLRCTIKGSRFVDCVFDGAVFTDCILSENRFENCRPGQPL